MQTVSVNNPWVDGGTGTDITISQQVLVQFWVQLTSGGIYFYVNGRRGVGEANKTFSTLVSTPPSIPNVLGLITAEVGDTFYLATGTTDVPNFLIDSEGAYIETDTSFTANARYRTTDVAPTA